MYGCIQLYSRASGADYLLVRLGCTEPSAGSSELLCSASLAS